MKSYSAFPSDPLGNIMWLSIASVMVLIGLRGVEGPLGIGLALLGTIPLLLMLFGVAGLKRIAMRARGH